MADFLPFVMQNLLNTPLAMHDRHAQMIVAALSGRLNIGALETSFADKNRGLLDRDDMWQMAKQGRAEADALRAERVLAGKPALSPSATPEGEGRKSFDQVGEVAIIRIWGTLTRTWGVGPYSGSTGYDGIQVQITDAINDPTVSAIWLDINSGGGTVDGLFDLADLIWSLNAKNGGKTIFAMCANYAYSAAYMLATCGDKVIVPASGGVGSVGTITLHADLSAAYSEEGIKVTVIRSRERKAIGAFGMPIDEEEIAHITGQVERLTEMFEERVARNMGIAKSAVAQTQSRDYMGEQAKAIGFVTDILPEVAAWAKLERRLARQ